MSGIAIFSSNRMYQNSLLYPYRWLTKMALGISSDIVHANFKQCDNTDVYSVTQSDSKRKLCFAAFKRVDYHRLVKKSYQIEPYFV